MRKPLIVLLSIAGVLGLAVLLHDYNQHKNAERRYESLRDEYLHPAFSTEFCRYWRISDMTAHIAALKEQFDRTKDEEMSAAYGKDERHLLYFYHLRMNNWMERETIFRAERLLEFSDRGDKQIGPYSIQLTPSKR